MASADVPIASNAGCYRPVKVIAPPGLVRERGYPAPVVHRIAITHRLATVLFGALHQAVPDRMPAAYYAVSYVVTFQTIDPKLGRKVLVEIEIGGCGALPYSDGASAHSFGMHNNSNIPIEMIEERHADHVPGIRAAGRFGWARAPARRARVVAGVAHRVGRGAALHQPRSLQVSSLRSGRRSGSPAERAST